jgi:hypothetical protein
MAEEIESRIDKLLDALDENLQWQPPTGLELLVQLLAKKYSEHEPEIWMV